MAQQDPEGRDDPWIPADYKDRQSERKSLEIRTVLSHRDRQGVEIVLSDLSSSGFMARCEDRVPIGSYVCLEIAGLGTVRARIRWQLGDKMGGEFLDRIRLSRCEWTAVTMPLARSDGA